MKRTRREFLAALGILLTGCATGSRREAKPPPAQTLPPPLPALPPVVLLPALLPVVAATQRIAVAPTRWQWIVGHHSGIASGNAEIYDRAHRKRGMENGLAYHFVIGNGINSGDGQIEIGARWLQQLHGGHVRDETVNQSGIGICCVGNYENSEPTPAQLQSFIALVEYLKRDVLKAPWRFAVHREVDGNRTVCPGRLFPVAAMHARFG